MPRSPANPSSWRNRVRELRYVAPRDLQDHPLQWRRHPQTQIAALQGILEDIGIAGALLAYESARAGGALVKIDGHLRASLPGDGAWPVLILDVDDREADLLLASVDPLAMLAEADAPKYRELLEGTNSDHAAVQAFLSGVAAQYGVIPEPAGAPLVEEDDSETSVLPSTLCFSAEAILDEAFRYYRETGFPYKRLPKHLCMQELNKLAALNDEGLLTTRLGYDIADTYHPHRFHGAAHGMRSPYEAFHDDVALRKALQLHWEHGNQTIGAGWFSELNIVNGTQGCSNFRPGVALAYYRRYCTLGSTVFDASTGYGGRLVGFLAAHLGGRYIGIDPSQQTYEANCRLAEDLAFGEDVELYCIPIEDIDKSLVENRCDFAFTSPPYFIKEHYSDEPTQSWKRYSTAERWRDFFLKQMLEVQYIALCPGAYAIINIADVHIGNKFYPLVEWTQVLAAEIGFFHLGTEGLVLTHRVGLSEETPAIEPILIFQKPAVTG
jgi:hypothetical protein